MTNKADILKAQQSQMFLCLMFLYETVDFQALLENEAPWITVDDIIYIYIYIYMYVYIYIKAGRHYILVSWRPASCK